MATKKKAVKAVKAVTPEVPKITLLQAFEQITTVINELKTGDSSAGAAIEYLHNLSERVNTEIPGVAFKVPTLEELQTLEKEPEYESSYSDSNCW